MRADHVMFAPLRELLIEGKATAALHVQDPKMVAAALMGAVMRASFLRFGLEGEVDGDALADELVPILVHGLEA